jgi:hypothetical protein
MAGWLGLIMAGWTAASAATAQDSHPRPAQRSTVSAAFPMPRVPIEELSPDVRSKALRVLERPTLHARGPAESFNCQPEVYHWLVDHPDQAVVLWRALGARCTSIDAEAEGAYRWHDPQAGEIHWHTIVNTPQQHIWYAEGRVRASAVLPASSVQAIVVLQYAEGTDEEGHPAMRHQMDLMVHTDSRALALAARLFGDSVPHAAEQYIGQMEMFFGGLAWYLDHNPRKAQALYDRSGISPGK